jgi:hypothetical protein
MATYHDPRNPHKPAPKSLPERHVALVVPPDAGGQNGVLRVTERRGRRVLVDEYFLDLVPSDLGPAYLVEKRDYGTDDGHRYHVLLGERPSCECLGFLHYGHCRHVLALAALVAAGRLGGRGVAA